MASFIEFEEIALSFPEVSVEPHFEKISFRVKKKIFATYDEKNHRVTVKLSVSDQELYSLTGPSVYPVDNNWGKQGWTFIELGEIDRELLKKVLTSSFCEVAPKTLSDLIKN
ncbi:MAG: MmcQ/YjbR family DNA-binding protein [Crocinitomicaceae bacterium]|nr:MmcQ/YjbR family DNA-binding protein [Crocinitomicaceae bacterium]